MSFLSRHPQYLRIVQMTQAEINAPTAAQLADYATLYQLSVRPYTRYISNGTSLVLAGEGGTAGVDVITAQAMIDSSISAIPGSATGTNLKTRTNHIGNDPAANVVLASTGETLEQYVARLEVRLTALGSTAPANTVQPTAPTGTKTVGQTLTAVTGTWTGASTYLYVWYRVNQTTGTFTATGGTASTYVIQAADYGYFIACSIAGVSAAGVSSSAVMSAVTTAVGSTLATNSAAPTLSGSAVAGSTITWDVGTWSNASTYSVQIYAGGVPVGSRTAASSSTTGTFDSANGQVGLALTCSVIAYNSTGVPSASDVASSNSITVTGSTPAIVNTAAPAWPATVYLNVQATLTAGTWTGTINATRTYDFYKTSITGANLLRSGNTIALFTPHNPEATGLPLTAGDTLYFVETVTETATGNTFSASSASKTLTATPATLALTQAQTGLTWTAGTPITSVQPITATGGTTPYTWSISTVLGSALPSGLTISSSSGIISGTPAAAVSQTTYYVVVTDAVGATDNASFTATVNAASVTPLASLPYPSKTEMVPTSSINYTDGATITNSGGIVKLTRITDPAGSGKLVYTHRVIRTDWATGPTSTRSEKSWIDFYPLPGYYMFPGIDYWMAFAVRPISGEYQTSNGGSTDNDMIVFQTHSESTGATQPDIALFHDIGRNQSYIQRSWSAVSQATTPQGTSKDWIGAYPTLDQWVSYIIHYRPGFTTGHAPALEVWQRTSTGGAFTKIITKTATTDFNTYNWVTPGTGGSTYPRIGIYKWGGTTWNSSFATIATNLTTLYWGQGASLYSEAEASLAGL